MIKYFKELLVTLKNMESYLKELSRCVVDRKFDGMTHGDRFVISIKHWND